MCNKILSKCRLLAFACLALAAPGLLTVPAARGEQPDLKAEFLQLCDTNYKLVEEQARAVERNGKRAHYWDSYVVRALCVAYDMTGKQEYLDACKLWADRMIENQNGMNPKGAYYWLNQQDFLTVAVHFPPDITPTVMMYCLESYSAGLPYLKPGTDRTKGAMSQLNKTFRWTVSNQRGQTDIDYATQWGSKFAGMPFHMYVYANHLPDSEKLVQAADKELSYVTRILKEIPASQQRDQVAVFLIMSYAEKVSPGSIDRGSRK